MGEQFLGELGVRSFLKGRNDFGRNISIFRNGGRASTRRSDDQISKRKRRKGKGPDGQDVDLRAGSPYMEEACGGKTVRGLPC